MHFFNTVVLKKLCLLESESELEQEQELEPSLRKQSPKPEPYIYPAKGRLRNPGYRGTMNTHISGSRVTSFVKEGGGGGGATQSPSPPLEPYTRIQWPDTQAYSIYLKQGHF